jgi:hypothetical protein
MNAETFGVGRELGRSIIDNASNGVATSLGLLRAIEATVHNLSVLEDKARVDCRSLMVLSNAIQTRNTNGEIDPSGQIAIAGDRALEVCDKLLSILRAKHLHAGILLSGDHSDDVCDSYAQVIDAVEHVQAAMTDALHEIKAHDDEFRIGIGPFDTVEEMLAALKA